MSAGPPLSNLAELLRSLEPTLNPGVYAFVSVSAETPPTHLPFLALFREAEGWTVVLEKSEAERANLPVLFSAAWITLRVYSDLEAVGLTAAVSKTLANAEIPCNGIAGAFHDHLFVPFDRAEKAMSLLKEISAQSSPDA